MTLATRPWERILAILAATFSLVLTILLWRSISTYQSMWLLPGLYFLEVVTLAILGATTFIPGRTRAKYIVWAAAGALLGFSILGAFSVGFFYLPVSLIFIIISTTSDVRNKLPIAAHLGVFLAAGLIQAGLMLAIIRFFRI